MAKVVGSGTNRISPTGPMPSTLARWSSMVKACIATVRPIPVSSRSFRFAIAALLPRMMPSLSQYRKRTRRRPDASACATSSARFASRSTAVAASVTAVAIKACSAGRTATRCGSYGAAGGIQPEEIDNDRHGERCDADAAHDQNPGTVVDDRRVPGSLQLAGKNPATGKRHDNADCAGDRARDRGRPEYPDRNELLALELFRIFRADHQDVGEEEHHRQAPDHGDGRLKGDVNPGREVGIAAEDEIGDRRDDR